MTVEIHRIGPDDGAALATVRLAALHDTPGAFAVTFEQEAQFTEEEWAEQAERAAEGRERAIFIAWAGEEPIGLAAGTRVRPWDRHVELGSMWTDPVHRRSGLGRSLVEAVVQWARQTDASQVELWVVRGNDSATRLYESMGFVLVAEGEGLSTHPCRGEFHMALALGPPELMVDDPTPTQPLEAVPMAPSRTAVLDRPAGFEARLESGWQQLRHGLLVAALALLLGLLAVLILGAATAPLDDTRDVPVATIRTAARLWFVALLYAAVFAPVVHVALRARRHAGAAIRDLVIERRYGRWLLGVGLAAPAFGFFVLEPRIAMIALGVIVVALVLLVFFSGGF